MTKPFTQQKTIDAINALTHIDLQDLKFVTEVTELLQKRAFEARSARALVAPTITRPTITPSAGRTQLRPHKVKPMVTQSDSLVVLSGDLMSRIIQRVSVGGLVKMKDTRDKHGIRMVTEFKFGTNQIACTRLEQINVDHISRYKATDIVIVSDPKSTELQYYRFLRDRTVHGAEKVVGVLKPLTYQPQKYVLTYVDFSKPLS